jgi:hypothetical protein
MLCAHAAAVLMDASAVAATMPHASMHAYTTHICSTAHAHGLHIIMHMITTVPATAVTAGFIIVD